MVIPFIHLLSSVATGSGHARLVGDTPIDRDGDDTCGLPAAERAAACG
jgi:hypothetical protein